VAATKRRHDLGGLSGAVPTQSDDPPPLDLADVPARPETLGSIRRALARWATLAGLDPMGVEDLALATYEAMANTAEHAYPLDRRPGQLSVHAARTTDHRVVVTVSDGGRWRPPPPDPGHRGRGLPLIHRLAHDVDVAHDQHGTTVRMAWTLPSRSAANSPDA